MSWCPTDSSYLLTCAKDNRTICWDTVTGEVREFGSSSGLPLSCLVIFALNNLACSFFWFSFTC